jgi:lantibiotic transport system ATP-binding protein
MQQPPIRLDDVWKSYGSNAAVRGLRLLVSPQSVFGFLGPNGAGKSTTIRMILGLQRPDRGSIELFGNPLQDRRSSALARIGSLVEAPSLYLHLTGRENLEVHRRLLDVPANAIARALEAVGLLAAAHRTVRGYSSGMKQRLGIAQALLGDPELLVLDEPTNGLDPAGIHEIRTLVRDLPTQRGVTVFLSSHLLAEIEQVATEIAIISQGTVKFQGSPADLRLRSGATIVARVDDPERSMEILLRIGASARVHDGKLIVAADEEYGPAEINAALVRAGVAVSHLSTERTTLEDAFLSLTHPEADEEAVAQ